MSSLKEDKSRILFLRHFKHQENILEREVERARNIGRGLRKRKLIVKTAYSSPSP